MCSQLFPTVSLLLESPSQAQHIPLHMLHLVNFLDGCEYSVHE